MKKITFFFLFSFSFLMLSAQFDPNTVYSIEARSSGRFMNGKNSSGIIFDLKKNNNHYNTWKVIHLEGDTYHIKNAGNGLMLSVKNGATTEGATLIVEAQNNLDRQKWIITKKNGFYVLKNKKSNLAVTIDHDYPETTNPNPDLDYAARYEQIGDGVQRSYANLMNQEFEIEPVLYNPATTLAVPQLGWKPNDNKLALLITPSPLNNPGYVVKDENGNELLSGNFTLFPADLEFTFNLYYYQADLSTITQPGNYTIEALGLTTPFIIGEDIYLNPAYPKGGTIHFRDLFNGFWQYNRYYPQGQELLEATLTLDANGKERFTFTGNTYFLEPYGWFDAHSRDSKLARSAKAISEFALAYFTTHDASNRFQLYKNLEYGVHHLLLTQNEDGSWPAGKIRDGDDTTPYDSRYYHWVINKDVNIAARCVRALAENYLVFKDNDPTLAAEILNKAVKGWEFITTHEDLIDENIKYRGYTVDILAAAIEMAFATGESQYFDKADEMINQSKYQNGIFVKTDGSWPAETGNRFNELGDGCAVIIAKYYEIARTKALKQKIRELLGQLTNFWEWQDKTPQGVPQPIIQRTTAFGNLKNLEDYTFNMMGIATYLNDTEAFTEAKNAFNLLTGLNAFGTSYIVGLGNKTPSVNFFKRSFENGVGAVLPGLTNTAENVLFQDFTSYKSTEGVVPTSSSVFFLLSAFNNFSMATLPEPGDLKFNEVKSNTTTDGASFVEIYNTTGKNIELSEVTFEIYNLNNNSPVGTLQLSGTLKPYKYYVIAGNNNDFYNLYGFEPDTVISSIFENQNTVGYLLKLQNEIIDRVNNVPLPDQSLEPGAVYIRKGYNNDGSNLDQHWYNAGQGINGTPGKSNNVIWETEQYAEACEYYFWEANGQVYSESGTYTYILPNIYGIDSILTLHLTITINKHVTQTDNLLIADEPDAEYQWLDCHKHFDPVPGATFQSFEPAQSGRYAVRITKSGCTVVSDCYDAVTHIEHHTNQLFKVYPNPTAGIFNIRLDKKYNHVRVVIRDLRGKTLRCFQYLNTAAFPVHLNFQPGIYLIDIQTEESRDVLKVVKL